ncbi:hypothetical protein HDV00_001315 [Rhizophlyctis rosea]|nr:hypothetical protein HDV00_001315 [Rhizophlyctis rosea]
MTDASMSSIPWDDLSDFSDLTSGSFGVLRRADYLGTEVAVKEFLDISDQPGFNLKKYIGREVEILKECRHPNVVQFMGCTIHEQKLYLVTEFVPGGNLKQFIASTYVPLTSKSGSDPRTPEECLPWRLRVSFAIDTARALVYLHAKKFIHRDLKADNLLLTENLRIKICDFGFSREQVTTPTDIKKLSFCGTDAYMAPEIMFSLPFDERADIFSFGVILCEIATRTSAMWDQAPDEPIVLNKDDWPEEEPEPEPEEEELSRKEEGPAVKADAVIKLTTPIKRLVPGFGIDMEVAGKWAKREGCPDVFLDLARECCEDEVEKRANLKEVLAKLRSLEGEIVKEAGTLGHVGAKWGTGPRLGLTPSHAALGDSGIGRSESVNSLSSETESLGSRTSSSHSLAASSSLSQPDLRAPGQDCSAVYHKRCAPSAPPTCGLPIEFRESLSILVPGGAGSTTLQHHGSQASLSRDKYGSLGNLTKSTETLTGERRRGSREKMVGEGKK